MFDDLLPRVLNNQYLYERVKKPKSRDFINRILRSFLKKISSKNIACFVLLFSLFLQESKVILYFILPILPDVHKRSLNFSYKSL